MTGTTPVEAELAAHPALADLPGAVHVMVARCGEHVVVPAGRVLMREGGVASTFYLILRGRVAVELPRPAGGPLVIATVDDGGMVGWSWLFAPHRWHFDARTLTEVEAVAVDAAALRAACDADPATGYHLVGRIAELAIGHLQAARTQLLDLTSDPRRR